MRRDASRETVGLLSLTLVLSRTLVGVVHVPAALLGSVYFGGAAAYYLTNQSMLAAIVQLSGMGLLILEGRQPVKGDSALFVILVALALGALGRCVVQGTLLPLSVMPDLLGGTGAALALRRGRIPAEVLRGLLIVVLAYLSFRLFSGVYASAVLPGRSRNHISVLLLGLVGAYAFTEITQRRSASTLIALWVAIVCVAAIGRAGIIAGVVFASSVIWANRIQLRSRRGVAGILLITTLVGFIWQRYGAIISRFVAFSTRKFRERGLESNVRLGIYEEYLRNIDITWILFGPSSEVVAITGFSLHSSLLQWHFLYGAAFVVPLAYCARTFWAAIHDHPVLAGITAAVVLRSLTDTVLLPGMLLDPALLALVGHYAAARTV